METTGEITEEERVKPPNLQYISIIIIVIAIVITLILILAFKC